MYESLDMRGYQIFTIANGKKTDEFELSIQLVESNNSRCEETNCVQAIDKNPRNTVPPSPDTGRAIIEHYDEPYLRSWCRPE